MENVSKETALRIAKLQAAIGKLLFFPDPKEKKGWGEKEAVEYADLLQAILEKQQIHIGPLPKKNPTFLLPEQQFFGIIRYNEVLKKEAPKDVISRAEIEALELLVPEMEMNDLIFYGHKDKKGKYDVLRTCELAWAYICSQCGEGRFWKSDYIQFKKEYFGLADGEPERPTGFYTKKLHKDDYEAGAIGKRFQKKCVEDTRKLIRAEGSWCMGSEGLQFMFTHPHYPELMDRDEVPYLDLPGLKVAPYGDSDFYCAPCLDRDGAKFKLDNGHVGNMYSEYGSGSLL